MRVSVWVVGCGHFGERVDGLSRTFGWPSRPACTVVHTMYAEPKCTPRSMCGVWRRAVHFRKVGMNCIIGDFPSHAVHLSPDQPHPGPHPHPHTHTPTHTHKYTHMHAPNYLPTHPPTHVRHLSTSARRWVAAGCLALRLQGTPQHHHAREQAYTVAHRVQGLTNFQRTSNASTYTHMQGSGGACTHRPPLLKQRQPK